MFKVAWRMMWSRKWVTIATLIAMILPTSLAVVLLVVRHQTEGALKRDAGQFDLVVGAKGGAMQLVLSSVYHLGMPTGNITYENYLKVKNNKKVKAAVPIGLGDNYEGYRIVGTELNLFDLERVSGEKIVSLSAGKPFVKGTFDAVIGAQVAQQSGLSIGDEFAGTHGLLQVTGAEVHDEFAYNVVGILEPTGNAHDRAIYVPIEAVWKVHHAEESVHQVFKTSQPVTKEVTSVLVQLHSAGSRLWILDEFKKQPNLMVAIPINEILTLSQVYFSPFQRMLLIITAGVVIISCLVILLALFQAIERRLPDLMILRSLGATRGELVQTLFMEVGILVGIGVLGGWLAGHIAVQALAGSVYLKAGLILNAWEVVPYEFFVIGGIAGVLLLCGLLPIFSLYRKSAVR